MKLIIRTISPVLIFLIAGISAGVYAQDLDEMSKEDIFKYNGGLNISVNGYGTRGMENRRDPLFYTINANLNLTLLNVVDIPVSAHYSKNDYSYSRPTFNHFGLSPNYKCVTLHLGYRSMQLSSYSLSGVTFLGAGVEIKPENFPLKFSGMYGRFAKGVPFKEDSTNTNSNNRFDVPGYERWGYGGKVTYKKNQQTFSLLIFKAADKPNSIPDPGPESGITPKENLVIGFSTKNTITEKISLNTEYNLSALTRDIRLPERITESFTYVNNLGSLFTPRYSTSVNGAFTGNLSYSAESFSLSLAYKRVAPDYKSLGTTYLSNDIENIHLNLQKSFFDNKLSLSGNLGTERNNLNGNLKNTNQRIIGGINCNIGFFKSLNISFNYSNFNSSTSPAATTLRDTFKYVQVSENYGINTSYQLSGKQYSHNFTLNTTLQTVNTLNRTATRLKERNTETFNTTLTYNFSVNSIKLNLNAALNYNYFQTAGQGKNIAYGPTLGAGKTFFNNDLRTQCNYSLQKNSLPGDQNATKNILRLNGSYTITSAHSLRFSMSMMARSFDQTKDKENPNQNEYKARITYNFNF